MCIEVESVSGKITSGCMYSMRRKLAVIIQPSRGSFNIINSEDTQGHVCFDLVS